MGVNKTLAHCLILPKCDQNVQKFHLLPQGWERYQIARVVEKPLGILSYILNLICTIFMRNPFHRYMYNLDVIPEQFYL